VQKENTNAVIPHFKGEIGLNTDILQMAHLIFAQTQKIHVGSAIRNIFCNGGPIGNAEAIKTFLTLQNAMGHGVGSQFPRILEFGYAAGRFPFSYNAFGIKPRDAVEEAAWEVVRHKAFQEASEIMLRLIRGDKIRSEDISPFYITAKDFREAAAWEKVYKLAKEDPRRQAGKDKFYHIPFYEFDKIGVIPSEVPLDNLRLTLGSHDPDTQRRANEILPVGVFNLSITPPEVIEETHVRMAKQFNSAGGKWTRSHMPRTVLLFLNGDENKTPEQQTQQARKEAESAWKNYWVAMEKTLDPRKVESAVENAIFGNPEQVAQAIVKKYHAQDRLMLWFDFNNHDNASVKKSMQVFMEQVRPRIEELLKK
jgi:alkanesulfonate monooxygenase SsuD/methylene tetrahydromethanopterin reductase-like flavin-dependent oxidoreductase (luciferase family)